jgi:hypothetical protein
MYVYDGRLEDDLPRASGLFNPIQSMDAHVRVIDWTSVDVVMFEYDMHRHIVDAARYLQLLKPYIIMCSPNAATGIGAGDYNGSISRAIQALVGTNVREVMPHTIAGFNGPTDRTIQREFGSLDRVRDRPGTVDKRYLVQQARSHRQHTPALSIESIGFSSSSSSSSSPSSSSSSGDVQLPESIVVREADPAHGQFFDAAWDEWSKTAVEFRRLSAEMRQKTTVFRARINNRGSNGKTTWPIYEPPPGNPLDASVVDKTLVATAKEILDASKKDADVAKSACNRSMMELEFNLVPILSVGTSVERAIDDILHMRDTVVQHCTDLSRANLVATVATQTHDRYKAIVDARIAEERKQAAELKWTKDIGRSVEYIKGMMSITGMGSTEIWRSRAALTGVADDAFQAAMIQCDLIVDSESMKAEPTVTNDCVVCLDEPKTRAFVPCGHQCICDDCATKLNQCPICKANATSTVKIYSC